MPHPLIRKTKAFTLIEVLMVVAIIAVIAVSAITSFVTYTDDYEFLSVYQRHLSILREARVLAVNNSLFQGNQVDRYGVVVDSDYVTLFVDDGAEPFNYELNVDSVIELYDFSSSPVQMLALDSSTGQNNIGEPVTLFYETGSGELTAFDGSDVVLAKSVHPYIIFQLCTNSCTAADKNRYTLVFQVSGLAEEFDSLNKNFL